MMKTTVPVYLPDRTEMGKAVIEETTQGIRATIDIPMSSFFEGFKENLVGLGVIYIGSEMRDLVEEERKGEKDDIRT